MAAWARLVAVTCLAGWAAGQAIPAARCPITTVSGGFGDVANFPLHDAAWNYDLPRVKCLVEQAKVNINKRLDSGHTPLELAFDRASINGWSRSDDPEQDAIITYLLSKGATPNTAVLSTAASDGRVDWVKQLVEAGADFNVWHNGMMPLHKAARCDFRMSSEQGASATIEYLVSQGANIMARTKGGETVLDVMDGNLNCPNTYKLVQRLMAQAKAKAAGSPQGAGGTRPVFRETKGVNTPGRDIACGQKDWQGKPAAFCKICGGRAAVEAACSQRPACVAYDMEGAGCGYLKAARGPHKQAAGFSAWVRA